MNGHFLDLGWFLLDQDRAAEAVPFLQRASAINTKCADCHGKLGRALMAAGDVRGGVKELEVAAKLDPANPKRHFQLGSCISCGGSLRRSPCRGLRSAKALYGQHSQD